MPAIHRIQLERDNDAGVHEVRSGERLEAAEPEPPGAQPAPLPPVPVENESAERHDKDEFERATTPFPGG